MKFWNDLATPVADRASTEGGGCRGATQWPIGVNPVKFGYSCGELQWNLDTHVYVQCKFPLPAERWTPVEILFSGLQPNGIFELQWDSECVKIWDIYGTFPMVYNLEA